MKKILILVTALALTIGATAQEKPFTYGVKAGLNFSLLSSGKVEAMGMSFNTDASDMLTGFFVSGHFNYSFGRLFGIQPELSFSTQGGKISWDDYGVEFTETDRLNYINIPILFEVKPMTNFSIFVGPQVGFNIYKSATIKGGGESETFSGSDLDDILKEDGRKFNSFDIAAVVGLQYAIAGKYLISARYNIGFTTVLDSDTDGVSISGGGNHVFQLGIGYQF